jgi:hypothetical protein
MFAIFHSKLYVCDFPEEEEEEGSKFEALSLSLCIDIDMCMRKKVLGEVVGSAAMLGFQNLRGGNCSLLGII